jgi:hypothetical protein
MRAGNGGGLPWEVAKPHPLYHSACETLIASQFDLLLFEIHHTRHAPDWAGTFTRFSAKTDALHKCSNQCHQCITWL